MEHTKLTELLNKVAQGEVSVEKAALELKTEPFEDLGFAKLDHHRKIRQGAAEVIYGAGKTPEQILKITEAFRKKGDNDYKNESGSGRFGWCQSPSQI